MQNATLRSTYSPSKPIYICMNLNFEFSTVIDNTGVDKKIIESHKII